MSFDETEHNKEKNIDQIVNYLTKIFRQATSKLEKPAYNSTSGANLTYKLQSEFAYLINEIMQGPKCMLQSNIAACNEFIDSTMQKIKKVKTQ